MVQNILTVAQFDKILNDYAGRNVSRVPVSRTTANITGQEILTNGTTADIKCYFMLTGQNFDYQKAGFLEKGNAVMLAKAADSVKKDDIIIADSKTYRIREAFDVPGVFDTTGSSTANTVIMVYSACNLFLME